MADKLIRLKDLEEIYQSRIDDLMKGTPSPENVLLAGAVTGCRRIAQELVKTVDAEPVVHAHWEITEEFPFCVDYACSRCGRTISLSPVDSLEDYPYCHCGAKMIEEVTSDA